jgi:hypothetical protein
MAAKGLVSWLGSGGIATTVAVAGMVETKAGWISWPD